MTMRSKLSMSAVEKVEGREVEKQGKNVTVCGRSGIGFSTVRPLVSSTRLRRKSDSDHQARGVLDGLLHLDEEDDGLLAIDDAAVVAEGHEHHGPDNDLAVDGDGPLVNRMHAENGSLRRIDDRRGQQRTEGAAVG